MEHSSIDLEAVMDVIHVALACVHYKATLPPKMSDVVPMLMGNIPINDFHIGFEYGEESGNNCGSNSSEISRTTSSFWKKEKLPFFLS